MWPRTRSVDDLKQFEAVKLASMTKPLQPTGMVRRASWGTNEPNRAHDMFGMRGSSDSPALGLAEKLLSPRPFWRPVKAHKPQDGAVRKIEIQEQDTQTQRHTSAVAHTTAALLKDLTMEGPVAWVQGREERCVGLFNVQSIRTQTSDTKKFKLVVKQAGPMQAASPSAIFVQERAWLKAYQEGSHRKLLFAESPRHSLLVMNHVEGRHLSISEYTPEICSWVAREVANVHCLPMNGDMLRTRGERRFPWSVERWIPFVYSKHRMSEATKIKLTALHDMLVQGLDKLPAIRTAVHGDVIPGNMLVQQDKKRVQLIDFEFSGRGDPMFDLAFFAATMHMPMTDAWDLLSPYQAEMTVKGRVNSPSDQARLTLYLCYQRLFRHVASHLEYRPHAGDENEYDRWLHRLHDDIAHAQAQNLI